MSEKNKARRIEIIIFAVYCISWILVSVFHEPWFDEAEAWQIARDASLKDILFVLPHYEGHPPLWHLILSVPAKLGVPYEIGLKTVGFLLSSASAFLLIFLSPLPERIKCLLPFTYFLFYQYGVIVRPYTMLLLALLLSALTFRSRDRHPFRFVFMLMLVCLSSAYGVVIAGGIAAAWVLDLTAEYRKEKKFRLILSDRRFRALFSLLIAAILMILQFLPYPDTLGINTSKDNNMPVRFVYSFFVSVSDCFLTDMIGGSESVIYALSELAAPAFIGIVLFFGLTLLSGKKELKYLIVPHVFLAGFTALVYFYRHHLGVFALMIVFWVWIALDSDDKLYYGRLLLQNKHIKTEREKKLIRILLSMVCGLCVVMPISWSVAASVSDIRLPYNYSREVAAYISDNHLEELNIMLPWGIDYYVLDNRQSPEIDELAQCSNAYNYAFGMASLPYFDKNIFSNLNVLDDHAAYNIHKAASEEENREIFSAWAENGLPEVMLSALPLKAIYQDSEYPFDLWDYSPVCKINNAGIGIWKWNASCFPDYIYARKDVIERYHLEKVPVDIDYAIASGLPLSYFDVEKEP